MEEALHFFGPGDWVKSLDVLQEGCWGLEEGVRALWEECRGVVHGGWVGAGVWVDAPALVDEEDDFEEVGGTSYPGGFFEAFQRFRAYVGGVEGFGEGAGPCECSAHDLHAGGK